MTKSQKTIRSTRKTTIRATKVRSNSARQKRRVYNSQTKNGTGNKRKSLILVSFD